MGKPQKTHAGRPAETIDAQIGTIDPKLTTEAAKALGVTQRLSTFTQHFPYAAYRVQNIGQAARSINGTLLLPGQVFSLNKTLGERTSANGYTKGFVIGPGGVFKEDLGGGVSTSATATWTAAFYAGLERIHTQAHSIWISRYRAGLEATVAWGSFDMSFKNDTPHAVLVTTIMKNTSITVKIWGTKVYDKIKAISGPRYNVSPAGAVRRHDHAPGGLAGDLLAVVEADHIRAAEIGMRLGLKLKGVSFPGHFLVKIRVTGGELVLDPYEGGRSLSEEDLRERLKQAAAKGRPLRVKAGFDPTAPEKFAQAHAIHTARF